MLPDAAAESLNEDPERLALACIPVLRYAEAYAAFRRGNKGELKTWQGNPVMELVELHAFDAAQEELENEEEDGEEQ